MFNFEPTLVGSMPHQDARAAVRLILENIPGIPAWPQLPRRGFCENMVVPFSEALPGRVYLPELEVIDFDTNRNLSNETEQFIERYHLNDPNAFAFQKGCTAGWDAFFELLPAAQGNWVKGQVTGPVSMGFMLTDQDRRPILYNEWLAEVLVKNTEMQARWQIRQLAKLRSNILLSVDEPSLSLFGSAHISLDGNQVINMLNPVIDAIHEEGALSCVHCCANTDWSLLMRTRVKVINLDAFGFLNKFSLYIEDLGRFLSAGGIICWGIVPNNEAIRSETAMGLADRLMFAMENIVQKGLHLGVNIKPETLANHSLITTSCGLGATSIENAENALQMLPDVGRALCAGWK